MEVLQDIIILVKLEKVLICGNIETGSINHTGGIVGEMYYQAAIIERCYNKGTIKLNNIPQGAGGISGATNVGKFISCFNAGNIEYIGTGTTNGTASIYKIGGITGSTYNDVIIKNCYNIGDTDTGGGIAGVICDDERQEIVNNYYLNEKSDYGYYSSGIENIETIEKNVSQMKESGFIKEINKGYDSYRPDTNNINNGYPILTWVEDIEIEKKPNKLTYKQNKEDLDLTGGKVKLKYNHSQYNTSIDMNSEKIKVTGFDNTKEGKIKLTVEYTDELKDKFEKEFEIEVIETIPPELEVKYSTTEKTNQDVTATIIANEEIQAVEGWNLAADKRSMTKVYTNNKTEEVTIKDLVENESKITVKVSNIDKVAPIGQVGYSTTEPTNRNVTATIEVNEKIKQVEGWTISTDLTILTKIFTVNKDETVTITDLAGNTSTVKVAVENIDKTEIEANVNYSTTLLTNQNVDVTINLNKKVKSVEGWELSTDGKKLTKTFEQNGEEEITLNDEAGNSKKVKVSVANIDKIKPETEVAYSITEMTNQDVIVTVMANENIQEVESWTLLEDGKTLTKTYNLNGNEKLKITDLAENEVDIEIEVSNIDKKAPKLEVKYNPAEETTGSVTVTIISDEEVQSIENWTLSEDKKSFTKTYQANGTEEVTVYDLAGNKTVQKIEIKNIVEKQDDTIAPTTIPKAGQTMLICIVIASVIIISIILRKRLNSFKDIK